MNWGDWQDSKHKVAMFELNPNAYYDKWKVKLNRLVKSKEIFPARRVLRCTRSDQISGYLRSCYDHNDPWLDMHKVSHAMGLCDRIQFQIRDASKVFRPASSWRWDDTDLFDLVYTTVVSPERERTRVPRIATQTEARREVRRESIFGTGKLRDEKEYEKRKAQEKEGRMAGEERNVPEQESSNRAPNPERTSSSTASAGDTAVQPRNPDLEQPGRTDPYGGSRIRRWHGEEEENEIDIVRTARGGSGSDGERLSGTRQTASVVTDSERREMDSEDETTEEIEDKLDKLGMK